MAETPTLALWSDIDNTSLELPGFSQRSMDTLTDGTFIRFEGDSAPRGFKSEALYRKWSLQATFFPPNYDQAQYLLALFETANASYDSRLYFDHGGRMADLNPFTYPVEAHNWSLSFDPPGSGIAVVSFELTEVAS